MNHDRIGKHILLIGLMGTGKTTVGRILAEELKRPLTDTDEAVERMAKQSIPTLFREEGEAGFRNRETRVLRDVLQYSPRIVTTGGGIVLREENRRLMAQAGWVAALEASAEELYQRLQGDQSRPLLQGDLRRRIVHLKRERESLYDFADVKLDTTGESPQETASRIILQWRRLSRG
ncbi:shikimate kinase [Paludifilum halophilum]|uniref:Shikimate kinase n=1 Tax=Paludifilum halophilum TaxID=1642702 RepID=A0A235B663_9BACL|nr:shikimate kinase [Paludifilum halophilum]OYD07780.1 hypothetical protein CHM34_09960 [Paludifilum halophilum]